MYSKLYEYKVVSEEECLLFVRHITSESFILKIPYSFVKLSDINF
jgi:hypothetical protein